MQRLLMILVLMCTPIIVWGQSTKEQILDNEIVPFVEELATRDGPPSMVEQMELMEMVRRFNDMGVSGVVEKQVISLDMNPLTWRTHLNELVSDSIGIAFCASSVDGLRTCDAAARHLRQMSIQCRDTVLGVIDLDVYEDVPLTLFQDAFPDPGDPNFIMLKRREGSLTPVRVNGYTNPDTVAIVLCPEHSKAFGHVFRFTMPFQ